MHTNQHVSQLFWEIHCKSECATGLILETLLTQLFPLGCAMTQAFFLAPTKSPSFHETSHCPNSLFFTDTAHQNLFF